ncbi:MAG: hypothetical protein QF886_12085, partial [Planctomycetota bacterium]|nr:hypothetical protein [Planctomycetota bacterium]
VTLRPITIFPRQAQLMNMLNERNESDSKKEDTHKDGGGGAGYLRHSDFFCGLFFSAEGFRHGCV